MTHYKKKENSQALNFVAEIVEKGIRNHPELAVGSQTETEGGARSVGNPPVLAQSGLTQALNLKAAIEYQDGNCINFIVFHNMKEDSFNFLVTSNGC